MTYRHRKCKTALISLLLFAGSAFSQDLVFTDSFENCSPGNRVEWDGGGDGTSWDDPDNWEGNTLPANGQSVSIRVPGQPTIIYDIDAGTTSIRCIDSSESISITGGSLTVEEGGYIAPGLSLSSAGILIVNGGLRVAGSWTQTAGTLDGTGTVTVTGLLDWRGGTQQGSGVTVADGGLSSGPSGSYKNLDTRTLTLNGASTLDGSLAVRLFNAATINNHAAFDFQTDMDISDATGGIGTFNNYATVSKTGGSGLSTIEASFNNSGTVTVASGELHVGYTNVSSATSSGNYVVNTNAILGVSGTNAMNGTFTGPGGFYCHTGGTTTINNTYSLGGPLTVAGSCTLSYAVPVTFGGDVTIAGGTTAFTTGPMAINANVVMSGGILDALAQDLPVAGSWTQTAGTLDGTGTVTVTGLLDWRGGTQQGSGVTVADGGLSSGPSGSYKNLDTRTLTLNGASTLDGSLAVRLFNAATINNHAAFDFQTDMDISDATGGIGTFNNYATVSKTGGSGLSTIEASFNNSGTVTVASGELHVGYTNVSSATSSGNYVVNTNAILGVSGTNAMNGTFTGPGGFYCHTGGTTTINNTYSLGGPLTVAGSCTLSYAVPVTFGGDVTIAGGTTAFTTGPMAINANVVMSGGILDALAQDLPVAGSWTQTAGTLDGTGTVTVTGLLDWRGGTQQGSGVTVADGGLSSGPSGSYKNLDTRTLTLNGASTLDGSLAVRLFNAATINNHAAFDFQTDMDISDATGGIGTFNNYATVSKTGGSGLSTIEASFNNSGTVTVASGELHVGYTNVSSATSSGNYVVNTNAILGVSGTNAMNGTFTGPGGFYCHTGGTTTINNTYSLGGPLTVAGSCTLSYAVPVTFGGDVTIAGGTTAFTTGPMAINANVVMSGGILDALAQDLPVAGSWTQTAGTLDGTGTVTVTGLLDWRGGTQQGSGVTVADGGLSSGPSGSYKNLDTRTLTLNGASTLDGSLAVRLFNAATINNHAAFDFQTDMDISDATGGIGTFNNYATVSKTGGSGLSTIEAAFNNSGSVTADTGQISFTSFTQDASGTLNVHINGDADFDVFPVTNAASLNGAIHVINGYTPAAATAFDVMTCNTCSDAGVAITSDGGSYSQTVAADKVTLTKD